MSIAEQVMIVKPIQTIVGDHGRIRKIFDVTNCPGIIVVVEGFKVGEADDFETVSLTYHLSTGDVFETADEALLAWDAAQNDHEIVEALGETILRWRHGLMRPLWSERKPGQKAPWIAAARSFRRLLNSLGFDIVRLEGK